MGAMATMQPRGQKEQGQHEEDLFYSSIPIVLSDPAEKLPPPWPTSSSSILSLGTEEEMESTSSDNDDEMHLVIYDSEDEEGNKAAAPSKRKQSHGKRKSKANVTTPKTRKSDQQQKQQGVTEPMNIDGKGKEKEGEHRLGRPVFPRSSTRRYHRMDLSDADIDIGNIRFEGHIQSMRHNAFALGMGLAQGDLVDRPQFEGETPFAKGKMTEAGGDFDGESALQCINMEMAWGRLWDRMVLCNNKDVRWRAMNMIGVGRIGEKMYKVRIQWRDVPMNHDALADVIDMSVMLHLWAMLDDRRFTLTKEMKMMRERIRENKANDWFGASIMCCMHAEMPPMSKGFVPDNNNMLVFNLIKISHNTLNKQMAADSSSSKKYTTRHLFHDTSNLVSVMDDFSGVIQMACMLAYRDFKWYQGMQACLFVTTMNLMGEQVLAGMGKALANCLIWLINLFFITRMVAANFCWVYAVAVPMAPDSSTAATAVAGGTVTINNARAGISYIFHFMTDVRMQPSRCFFIRHFAKKTSPLYMERFVEDCNDMVIMHDGDNKNDRLTILASATATASTMDIEVAPRRVCPSSLYLTLEQKWREKMVFARVEDSFMTAMLNEGKDDQAVASVMMILYASMWLEHLRCVLPPPARSFYHNDMSMPCRHTYTCANADGSNPYTNVERLWPHFMGVDLTHHIMTVICKENGLRQLAPLFSFMHSHFGDTNVFHNHKGKFINKRYSMGLHTSTVYAMTTTWRKLSDAMRKEMGGAYRGSLAGSTLEVNLSEESTMGQHMWDVIEKEIKNNMERAIHFPLGFYYRVYSHVEGLSMASMLSNELIDLNLPVAKASTNIHTRLATVRCDLVPPPKVVQRPFMFTMSEAIMPDRSNSSNGQDTNYMARSASVLTMLYNYISDSSLNRLVESDDTKVPFMGMYHHTKGPITDSLITTITLVEKIAGIAHNSSAINNQDTIATSILVHKADKAHYNEPSMANLTHTQVLTKKEISIMDMTINKTSPDTNITTCKVVKLISVSYNNPKAITILAQMALSYMIYISSSSNPSSSSSSSSSGTTQPLQESTDSLGWKVSQRSSNMIARMAMVNDMVEKIQNDRINKKAPSYREMTTVIKTMLQDIKETASMDMINKWTSMRKKWMTVRLSLKHMATSLYWHHFEKARRATTTPHA
jgi:hypothetical protein